MTEKTKPKPKTKSKPQNKPKRENKTDAKDFTERAIQSGSGRLNWVVLALLIVGVAILVYVSGFKCF